ncbi:isopentenyl-diphosphate Delta-isomerase [uncultured Tateyamaria sp.]|uniref:isopentenyl-diphosphate Delta-isomerase n=1 Tax=Tateyamaria sp. 1078 TaxID=3417464 RepID=UPI00260C012C|nr:isopentenyl-diphosphate Delta-isomerase [uncultured Tateyamaria sp.]
MSIMIPAWVDGTLTPVEKLEAHQRGLRHKAVSVFVIRGTEVLLQQRAMGKYHTPGLWANTCCTHPDWDEAPSVCATRRLNEELGITGLPLEHRHHLEYRADVGDGLIEHEVVDVYLGRVRGDLHVAPNPDEVMAYKWTDYHDLKAMVQRHPERFTPWLRIYLTDHADVIFGADLAIAARV